jgi:hypothetical protein
VGTHIIAKAEAVFPSGEVLVYETELAPVKGMEAMSNPEGLRLIKRNSAVDRF